MRTQETSTMGVVGRTTYRKNFFGLVLLLCCLIETGAVGRTLVVTNLDVSGSGTLQQSISDALEGDSIIFAVEGTINLNGYLMLDKNLQITGPGADKLQINGGFLIMTNAIFAANSIVVSLSDLTITNAHNLGGIRNYGTLTITRCRVIGCQSDLGGGIYNGNVLTLKQCSILENYCTAAGGGICAEGSSVLVLDGCTVSGNYGQNGGGIFCGPISITNSTVSENVSEGNGGGICGGGATIQSCTIVSNTIIGDTYWGWGAGPGIYGPANARNSIIAGNTVCIFDQTSHTTTIIISDSAGNSLERNLVGGNPGLGPLQDNGGPTFTHALLPGSPAIGAGNSGSLAVDQRGFARHTDASDIGAFEFTPSVPTILKREFTKDRSFCLGFRAPSGSTNVTWSSPNLRDWLPLGAAQEVSPGTFEFIDLGVADQTNRFYQFRQP